MYAGIQREDTVYTISPDGDGFLVSCGGITDTNVKYTYGGGKGMS